LVGVIPKGHHSIQDVITWSKEFEFVAPPQVGPTENLKFFAYGTEDAFLHLVLVVNPLCLGDMGTSAHQPFSAGTRATILKILASEHHDFVAHFGDLSYAWGRGHV
jgi:hypothetical protein